MPACICGHTPRLKVLSKKVFRPLPVEVQTNPRSRSARMRVAECI
jgi:16S rRNA (cytosine1402-N4)-methyltransferase